MKWVVLSRLANWCPSIDGSILQPPNTIGIGQVLAYVGGKILEDGRIGAQVQFLHW